MRRSKQSGPCWEWGGRIADGYGEERGKRAHRVMYERIMGVTLTPADELHHRCHNTTCVNPWHMEVLDRIAHARIHGIERMKDECPAGHEYTPENTYVTRSKRNGTLSRHCRKCRRDRWREKNGKTGRVNKTKANPSATA